ncbi:MAG: ribonuclease III [Defluviitaleaceae bacterium]|nr:ribonuclease III [Defluviitaleaceae bacterium]MCL2836591.1 ribonuclease III [Defluviitaleaceae bacterium]
MNENDRNWEKDALGYMFNDAELLTNALTHSSYINEGTGGKKDPPAGCNNERLEFLGDAVLELVMSEHIFLTYPELTEGEMTKLRASIVCEPTLSKAARALNMGRAMRMGRGEEQTGGRERGSILADCFEAVAGAVFLDGGFKNARVFIIQSLNELIKERRENFMTSDYKTHLQELVQRDSKEPLEYTVIAEEGPAHDRTFVVELVHAGRKLSTGRGKSKKEAEQNCAKQAIPFFHN